MDLGEKPETKICGRCGESFGCGARSGNCWCQELPPLPKITLGSDCLCASCLKKATEIQSREKLNP